MSDNNNIQLTKEEKLPLLSVIIATKNRQKYCIAAINSLLKIDKERDLQIAISDNSDENYLADYIKTLSDPRIVYTYTQVSLSSIDNFNKVTELATGKYICMIGDDDTLLSGIIDYTKWALKNNIDSFTFKFINYYWPQENDINQNGYLVLEQCSNEQKQINVGKQIEKLVKNGFVNYFDYYLPKVYHGVVKLSILQEIRKKTGNFYGGLSPDIYASVALSTIVNKHFYIDKFLSIAGACPSSSTAKNLKGEHCGELKNAPHFIGREFYCWNKEIPAYYSVETIWADSGICALKELNQIQLLKKYNPYKLLSWAIYTNRKYILKLSLHKTFYWRKVNQVPYLVFFLKLLFIMLSMIFKIILKKIKNKNKNKLQYIYNISNIKQAEDYLILKNIL